MKMKSTIIIVSLLLMGRFFPAIAGQSATTQIEETTAIGDQIQVTGPVLRIYFIGTISDIIQHYEYEGYNYTIFTAQRAIGLEVQRYNIISRAFGITHYRNMQVSFSEEVFTFHGFFGNRFVFGYFEYTDF